MPPAVADVGTERPRRRAIERSPLNADGWYAYGAPDARGTFVCNRSYRCFSAAKPDNRRSRTGVALRPCLGNIIARKDDPLHFWLAAIKRRSRGSFGEGDSALVIHTYGGIGGRQRGRPRAVLFRSFRLRRSTYRPRSASRRAALRHPLSSDLFIAPTTRGNAAVVTVLGRPSVQLGGRASDV